MDSGASCSECLSHGVSLVTGSRVVRHNIDRRWVAVTAGALIALRSRASRVARILMPDHYPASGSNLLGQHQPIFGRCSWRYLGCGSRIFAIALEIRSN